MENMAKALEIAGTVLITLMVIVALIFMFREIAGSKSEDAKNADLERIEQFNKSYESFANKTITGLDLFSLANKIEDYRLNNEKITEGYKDIEFTAGGQTKDYFISLNKKFNDEVVENYR